MAQCMTLLLAEPSRGSSGMLTHSSSDLCQKRSTALQAAMGFPDMSGLSYLYLASTRSISLSSFLAISSDTLR